MTKKVHLIFIILLIFNYNNAMASDADDGRKTPDDSFGVLRGEPSRGVLLVREEFLVLKEILGSSDDEDSGIKPSDGGEAPEAWWPGDWAKRPEEEKRPPKKRRPSVDLDRGSAKKQRLISLRDYLAESLVSRAQEEFKLRERIGKALQVLRGVGQERDRSEESAEAQKNC